MTLPSAILVASIPLGTACRAVSARAREAMEALFKAIVPVIVIGQPVNQVPVATEVTVPVQSPMAYSRAVSVEFTFTNFHAQPVYVHGVSPN